jgi:glycolate oxidase iron-sulfur subunit
LQTSFSKEALDDPAMQASEKILRTCVHCGFCTATCPTYLLLGDELDSPRGRIYLMKEMLEGGKPPTADVVKHIDRCLSCLSCMTTCPSGVHYMHLVDHARAHIEEHYARPWHERLLRALLAKVLPYPARFRAAVALTLPGRFLKPMIRHLPKIGPSLGAMIDLAPTALPPRGAEPGQSFPAQGARKGRVALLSGCAQPVLDPAINAATIRLLNRLGIEVILPEGEGCCGALVHHMGREEEGHAFARRMIDVWMREIEGDGLDAIIITASGCGTTIKDYGFMFRADPAYAAKAVQVSALAKDITEYLEAIEWSPVSDRSGIKISYHSACSMQHGQQIRDTPKKLLQKAGFKVSEVPEGHICCGSAGTYNMLQPEISAQLRARKVGNIVKTKPDIIATGNLGCMTQIGKGLRDDGHAIPIVHTVQLIDWSTGGPKPEGLASLQTSSG